MIIQESVYGQIIFRNGTVCNLTDSTVISASVRRQACSGNRFEIGGVYAAQLTLKAAAAGTNSFRLRGAKILLYSRYGSETAAKMVGRFWITEAKRIAGDIYQMTALDAVSWLDSSSFNATEGTIYDSVARYFESQGGGWQLTQWCSVLTGFVNSLVQRMTGESNALIWQDYNETANGVYTNHYAKPYYGGDALYFFLSTEVGSGLSDCPRDLFRYLAMIAGGFIHVNESGYLTLGQFSMPEFGMAEVSESEIQQDSCEIADYQLQETVMTVQSEIGKGIYDDSSSTEIADHYSLAPIRFQLDSNPFLDGFAAGYCRGDSAARYGNMHVLVDGLYYFHHRMRTAADPDTTIQRAEFRPFSCTVHSEQRFHLGQKIGIHHQGSYYESEITSAIWNFRGGWVLSCAGADSRSMQDALRMSRADKAIIEARTRFNTLAKKI